MNVVEELIKLRKEQALTLRELSVALDMTEKAVWAIISNGANPQQATRTKIRRFVDETNARLAEEKQKTMDRYETTVLNIVYSGEGGRFWAKPTRAGEKFSQASYPYGIARKDVWYQDFVDACNIVGDDKLLLDALNHMAQTGLVKIISIFVPRRRPASKGEGIMLKFEAGTAHRAQAGQDEIFEMTRSYDKDPLSQAEMIPDAIRNPREAVEDIRRQRHLSAREMFGDSGIEAEIREHKERVADGFQQRRGQLELVGLVRERLERGDKDMHEDFKPSEYDEVRQVRKTREIVEIKRVNNTRVPQIFYNHDGSKVILEPGEGGIQTKMRPIKKLVVEDKVKK